MALRLVLLAGLLLGAFAGSASAGTLSYDGSTLVFTGGDNLNHQVQFRLSSDGLSDEVIDTQPITGGPSDCFYVVNPTWVSCPGHPNVRADLGAGNDTVTTARDCFNVYTINLGDGTNDNEFNTGCPDPGATATVNAGSGTDTLRGGSGSTTVTLNAGGGADNVAGGDGPDIIHGGDGNDVLDGYAGNDQVYGENGNDTIRGHSGDDTEDGGPGDDDIGYSGGISDDDDQGADDVRGGPGNDRLRLDAHTGGMTISLDEQANDGAPGEGDNIHSDIEQIDGTNAGDSFTGSPGPDHFEAGTAGDTIHGGGGNDTLSGNSGDDRVYGDAGNDTVYGSYGNDIVDGGSGTDQVFGDLQNCSSFSCPAGNDQLFIRDGEVDQANCGSGADTVQADQIDVISTDGFQACESIDRSAAAPAAAAPAGGANAGGAAAALKLVVPASITSKGLLKSGLTIRLTCPGACKIAAELRYKSKKLGAARKTLLKKGPAKLVVRVSKKAKRTVRALKRGTLTLRLKVTNAAGKTTSVTKTIKFKH